MKVLFNIVGLTQDRRSKEQLAAAHALEQQRLDKAIENRWRENVAANVRRRLERRVRQFINTHSTGVRNG